MRELLPYTDCGDGEPALVMMHYFGGSAREWVGVTESLSRQHRCCAVDMPGFGMASGRDGFSVRDMAAEIQQLVDNLHLRSYVLIGHSMSGKVAITLASLHPAGLQGLILVAPSPPSPEPMTEKARRDMLESFGRRKAAESTVKKITGRQLPADLYQLAVDDNLLSSAAAWMAWLEFGSREDLSRDVGVLDIPALVVAGEKDPVLPAPIQNQAVLPHLANGRLQVVADSGHLIPLEQPAALSSQIAGFCNSLG